MRNGVTHTHSSTCDIYSIIVVSLLAFSLWYSSIFNSASYWVTGQKRGLISSEKLRIFVSPACRFACTVGLFILGFINIKESGSLNVSSFISLA
jgi:hypothetical protein